MYYSLYKADTSLKRTSNSITEGAHFRGSVDMRKGAVGQPESKRKPVKIESANDSLEAVRVAPAAR